MRPCSEDAIIDVVEPPSAAVMVERNPGVILDDSEHFFFCAWKTEGALSTVLLVCSSIDSMLLLSLSRLKVAIFMFRLPREKPSALSVASSYSSL